MGETTVMSTRPLEKVLAAPEVLSLESRITFRRTAVELLEQLAHGSGRLVLDLSGTRQVDSAGLGALIGGLAGGGKGAAIGAGVGAGGGTAGAALTGQRDIRYPPETRLRFRLKEDLEVEQ